jgi:hypothetical protein
MGQGNPGSWSLDTHATKKDLPSAGGGDPFYTRTISQWASTLGGKKFTEFRTSLLAMRKRTHTHTQYFPPQNNGRTKVSDGQAG